MKPSFKKIKILALDFDGTLTDGFVYVDQKGNEMVRCSRRDSLGTNMLQKRGIFVVIISKEKNPVVKLRAKKMGVDCFSGVATGDDKLSMLSAYAAKKKVLLSHVAYVGDDVNDLAVLKRVGFPMSVANADPSVKKVSLFISSRDGGNHAVREICDNILKARGY